jgi:sugar phosphate permease
MEKELGFSKSQLGIFDTALLLPYALVQVVNQPLKPQKIFRPRKLLIILKLKMFLGPLGDRFGARRTFGFCLIATGVSMFSFGSWSSFSMLVLLLFLNGSFQVGPVHYFFIKLYVRDPCNNDFYIVFYVKSMCWPSSNKGLGAWVTDQQRSTVFGYYGTCPFVGGIIGTALAVNLSRYL